MSLSAKNFFANLPEDGTAVIENFAKAQFTVSTQPDATFIRENNVFKFFVF